MSEHITEINPASTPVLVVGASGYLGSHIVAHLRQRGYPVRALVRNPEQLKAEREKGVEVVVGQATRPETLQGLCDGISVVISALGVRSLARRPTPWEVDYQANLNILACAQKAGVNRFIFLAVLNGDEARTDIPVVEPRERFIDTLVQSDLAWTILRVTGVFNDMEMIFQQARRGRVFLPGNGMARINPIHGDDVAREAVRSIEDIAARNKTYSFGGPDVFTYTEIARMAFRALGTSPHITYIAPWLVDGLSQILKPFNPTGAGFLRFFRWVSTTDVVGALTGQVHLSDFFVQLAKQNER